jgi:hypothetical protein
MDSDLLPGVPLVESPLFAREIDKLPAQYRDLAADLNEKGYAVVDFPDAEIDDRIERIREALSRKFDWRDPAACPLSARVQDAWKFDPDVRAIACNAAVVEMLSALYGRQAFPFQTLNFPVGTQQPAHSDHIHFCSIPERFMCGVWVAFEDIDESNGPLFYYPGSHKWASFQSEHLGISSKRDSFETAVHRFTRLYQELPEKLGLQRETFLARKGQALIWASNLVHGGSPHNDWTRSRWSQVTHYFFKGCGYTTPLVNDTHQGKIRYRRIVDATDGRVVPNVISGAPRPRFGLRFP